MLQMLLLLLLIFGGWCKVIGLNVLCLDLLNGGQQETFLWNINIFIYKYIYILSFENIEIRSEEKKLQK